MNIKYLFLSLISLTILVILSCKKTDSITTNPDAILITNADTLHFDTVFSTTVSPTQSFKIFNNNDKKIVISTIELMGGNASFFRMNVDGIATSKLTNIEIAANDSMYVFVKISPDSNGKQHSFFIQDSILINYNGNNKFVQLDAYGQNAIYLKNKKIVADTTFTDSLPIVVLGGLYVAENATLTINKNTKIFVHANAPITIDGTLNANGNSYAPIVFTGDRLDEPYKYYSASWSVLTFTKKSDKNVLNYVTIQNAYDAIMVIDTAEHPNKLTLNQCKIDNSFEYGIYAENTTVAATNCLISNNFYGVFISSGGHNYLFNQCTIVGYDNDYVQHKHSAVTITNTDADGNGNVHNLDKALFNNCIMYGSNGVDDEVNVYNKNNSPDFHLTFKDVLYRSNKNDYINNSLLKNQDPQFDSLDAFRNYYNFDVKPTSPCVNTGNADITTTINIEGKPRIGQYNLGCY